MYLLIAVTMAAVLFLLQLILCVKARKKWVRFLPGILTVAFELLCWGMYLLARMKILEEIRSIEIGFAGAVLGMLGLGWIVSILAAWLLYGVGKLLYRVYRRKIIWRM